MGDQSHEKSVLKQAQVVVVMVPFPVQSHLNQLLQLACLISSHNIPVHYACSATHIHQAKLRFNHINHLDNTKIQFHELPTPHFSSPPPDPYTSKFPGHLQPSFEASLHLRQPVAALLREISTTTTEKLVVIHDVLMSYVIQDTTSLPRAESYAFNPVSAFSSFFDGWQLSGKSFPVEELEGLPSIEGCYTPEILKFAALQSDGLKSKSGIICNSCRPLEAKYLDLVANQQISKEKLLWAIGPLNLAITYESRNSDSRHECLEWLDEQSPKSVIYVSFGTLTSITDEQIEEIAMGLEKSEQKFIWVLRDADKGDIFAGDLKRAELPDGYEERVKNVGMVVRDWVPQFEILGHPSTGGFMSHCGWNSCLESITMGVPIAAWPMHSDQPKNAFLVTNIMKAGLEVSQWETREELVTSSTIAEAVHRLLASKEGEELRRRAEELSGAARQAVEEGGISRVELESFIAHITR